MNYQRPYILFIFVRLLGYVCYNRARKWNPCDGQTGYTTHILDAKVDAYLCELFDSIKQKGISTLIDEKSELLEAAENLLMETERQLEKAQRQYDEMKSQLMHSIEAAEPSRLAIVMEVLDSAYEKIAVLKQQQSDLQYQIEEMTEAIMEAEKNCERIIEWANIYHICGRETRKMIAGYMLKRVEVSRGYHLSIQLNDFGIANITLGNTLID